MVGKNERLFAAQSGEMETAIFDYVTDCGPSGLAGVLTIASSANFADAEQLLEEMT